MSNIALVSPATGTATFSITTPSGTSTDRTLTLPDNSGTVLTSATTTGFPAGSVIQVVQGTFATLTTQSSTAYADTGLTVSITPSSASSKVLVVVFLPFRVYDTVSTRSAAARLMRNATSILETTGGITQGGDSGTPVFASQASMTILDSPSSASAVTYKTQGAVMNVGNAVDWCAGVFGAALTATIIAMEIAA